MDEKGKLSNFIPISRDIFKHHLWEEKRIFSKFEAWLFLLQEAKFEDSKILDSKSNSFIIIKRGDVYASFRFMADYFKWSTTKVANFIELLESDSMVKKKTHEKTGQTIVTICNYDVYNVGGGCEKDSQKDAEKTQKRRRKDAEKTNYNIENKDNIDNILKEPKTFFLNGVQVAISENYVKALEEMQSDASWIETNTMNLRMVDRTLTPDNIKEKIIEFFVLRTNEGNIETPTTKECKQHFANWVRIDLSKQEKQLKNEQPQVQRIQRDPYLERMAELRRRATGIGNDNK